MSKDKIVVLFPGVRYSVDCPLLYYPAMYYEKNGYKKIAADYRIKKVDGLKDQEEYLKQAKKGLKKQFSDIDLSKYTEVCFVSKSIGTVLALWLEEELGLKNVVHVLMTPIERTLPLLKRQRHCIYAATGTEDKLVDSDRLRKVCKKMGYPLQEFEGTGHRLEPVDGEGRVQKSLEVMQIILLQIQKNSNN